MNKFIWTMLLNVIAAVSISAQSVVEKFDSQKFFDNTYVTVNGGVARPTISHYKDGNLFKTDFWQDMNANVGVRVGKEITPIFGVALGTNAYFSEFGKQSNESKLWVKYLNTAALAKVNVLNIFGYNPDRKFNLSMLAGPGWGHDFVHRSNDLTANMAINAAFDITKRLSLYIEPAIMYGLENTKQEGVQFNVNRSVVQLNGGLVWKFGKTTFPKTKYVTLTDYEDIVNTLNAELAKKPKEIVKTLTNEVEKPILLGKAIVLFAQNSDELVDTTELDVIPADTHVTVKGFASPEGTAKYNKALSERRAEVVTKYLTGRGVIVDDCVGLGSTGDTSNRVVIVY